MSESTPNTREHAQARTPCVECGFYLIHDGDCSSFNQAEDDALYGETAHDPIDAEDALLSFEQWVRPWCNCPDCQKDAEWKKSLFSFRHDPGCMVVWLHRKLAREHFGQEAE